MKFLVKATGEHPLVFGPLDIEHQHDGTCKYLAAHYTTIILESMNLHNVTIQHVTEENSEIEGVRIYVKS